MVDFAYSDAELAGLYDTLNSWGPGDEFYLDLVMAAGSALDVGCGSGSLLHRARANGHTGRLCGLDPAEGMLSIARKQADIEWVLGDLTSAAWLDTAKEFDLVVMNGHAFQVFITDSQLADALTAIRAALAENGRFAFETRNPAARAWEQWIPENAVEVRDSTSTPVRVWHQVRRPIDNEIVTFTTTFAPEGHRPRTSESSLRFLEPTELTSFLECAGFTVEEQYGDWSRSPLTEASPEIITIAR